MLKEKQYTVGFGTFVPFFLKLYDEDGDEFLSHIVTGAEKWIVQIVYSRDKTTILLTIHRPPPPRNKQI